MSGEVRVGFGKRSGADLFGIQGDCLYLRCFRTYRFTADEIVSIEARKSTWFDSGVRIVHGRADDPRRMTFHCRDGSDEIFELLERAAFAPRALEAAGRSSLIPAAHVLLVALAVYAIGLVLVRLLH